VAYLLQQLLTMTAARLPDKEAVVCRRERLSYRELDQASNRLARLLRARGVEPGDRVGFYFGKSVYSVISMFGILKAGAAYVPIDPQAPVKRVSHILRNCGAKGVITSAAKTKTLGAGGLEGARVEFFVLTDNLDPAACDGVEMIYWSALAQMSAAEVEPDGLVENDLAYILYTSGSTGDPKGVMLTHRNALTFIEWCAETFEVRADDRLSNHAPLHFDLSVFDIYNAIVAGATVFMVDEETVVFPTNVTAFIEANKISVWYSVPSALVQLLLHGGLSTRTVPKLRLVLYAGEPFPIKHLRALTECLPNATIYNLYGPTETNVCTFYRVPRPLPPGIDRIPIGKACANTQAVAYDEEGRKIHVGGEGELFVRGPSVTPGYWGDEEKTSRAVTRDPSRAYLNDRVYRTGDIVTLDDEGNYIFLGRRDHMIKSRGYRIELGEIEAALYSHPSVAEAAAVAVPDEEIGNRLWAFVAVNTGDETSKEILLAHCAQRVPGYMLPERIELCERLPKTSTGKVDRRRLLLQGTY